MPTNKISSYPEFSFNDLPRAMREVINRLARLESLVKDRTADVPDPDERITRADIRRIYKVSFPTIHNCMKRGLPYEKVGRKTLFRRADVDAYFQKKGQKKA